MREGRRRAEVHGCHTIVEIHDDVDARVYPCAIAVGSRAVLGWPSVDHPSPHDDDCGVVPEMQEAKLLLLLAKDYYRSVCKVKVLRA